MRALLVALLMLAAGVAACGDGAEIDLGDDGPVSTEREGAANGDANDAGGGGADDSGSADDSPALDDRGPLGALGPALLGSSVPQAVIEVDTSPNTGVSDEAVNAVGDALVRYGGKQVGHRTPSPELPSRDVYTADDLRRLATEHRDQSSGGDTVTVYIMVLSGEYEDSSATGVAFEAGSFAVFPDRLRSGLVQVGRAEQFETAVLLHELGHLFGLVNLTGEGAFHEDPEHPGHSDNRDSVMYWAIEDVSIANVFRGGPPTTFDDADRQEMANLRQ